MKHLHLTVLTITLWAIAVFASSPGVQGFALMAAFMATLELFGRE